MLEPTGVTTMSDKSEREDLNHKPENAGKVGEQHKQLNEEGEVPQPLNKNDPGKAPVPSR
jgi:hypothetical protein